MGRERDILFLHVGGGSQKKGKESLDGETVCTEKTVPVMEISLVIDVILQKLHLLVRAHLSVKPFVRSYTACIALIFKILINNHSACSEEQWEE